MTDIISRTAFLNAVTYSPDGLVPAIAQSAATGDVLMMAWMNKETLAHTLATGEMTYWSRSRKQVWKKGETSGHTQRVVEAYVDCDGDVLLFKVDQIGPACHTGAPNCFFRKLDEGAK
jgi:phosphoribosyl-AMP cyclohydrolase